MKKLLFIILLFFTLSSFTQNVEWIKIYDWNGGYDSPSDITYCSKNDNYLYIGGHSYFGKKTIIGHLDNFGDTIYNNTFPSDPLIFRLVKVKKDFVQSNIYIYILQNFLN